MKKVTLLPLVLFLFVGLSACSQNRVPDAVRTAFNKKFPTVQKADWGREGKTEWEAEFTMNGKDMSANFDLDGHWKETETTLSINELPEKVRTALQQQFSDFNIKEAAYTETESANVYEVIIKKGRERLEITFNTDGKVLNKEKAGND